MSIYDPDYPFEPERKESYRDELYGYTSGDYHHIGDYEPPPPHGELQYQVDWLETRDEGPSEIDYISWNEENDYVGDDYDDE